MKRTSRQKCPGSHTRPGWGASDAYPSNLPRTGEVDQTYRQSCNLCSHNQDKNVGVVIPALDGVWRDEVPVSAKYGGDRKSEVAKNQDGATDLIREKRGQVDGILARLKRDNPARNSEVDPQPT